MKDKKCGNCQSGKDLGGQCIRCIDSTVRGFVFCLKNKREHTCSKYREVK
jgi:hypothetical protein